MTNLVNDSNALSSVRLNTHDRAISNLSNRLDAIENKLEALEEYLKVDCKDCPPYRYVRRGDQWTK